MKKIIVCWLLPVLFFLFAFVLLPGTARSQVAKLIYSPCMYCPECFNFCAGLPPDPEEPLCPVCQEGAPGVTLPRTGQVLCYDPVTFQERDCAGTGQDGHIRAGAAWPEPRFTDNQDGTVTDQLTGLVWLQDANCIAAQHPAFDNDGVAGDGRVSWDQALEFVRRINDGTYPNCGAGQFDWRLPNINELESLMHNGVVWQHNWLMGQGFTNVHIDDLYWSSTTATTASWWAWTMSFLTANGTREAAGKYAGQNYYVWPVRGATGPPAAVPKTGQVTCYQGVEPFGEIPCDGTGQDGELQAGAFWPSPRWIDNSDGTVTDNLTGLMWLKDANCFGRLTWGDALQAVSAFGVDPDPYACDDYTAAHNDWRLPNLNELESLLSYYQGSPASWLWGNGLLFKNVAAYYYFSATVKPNLGSWAVHMGSGAVDVGNSLYVWPVRTAPPRFILDHNQTGRRNRKGGQLDSRRHRLWGGLRRGL